VRGTPQPVRESVNQSFDELQKGEGREKRADLETGRVHCCSAQIQWARDNVSKRERIEGKRGIGRLGRRGMYWYVNICSVLGFVEEGRNSSRVGAEFVWQAGAQQKICSRNFRF